MTLREEIKKLLAIAVSRQIDNLERASETTGLEPSIRGAYVVVYEFFVDSLTRILEETE